MPHRTASKPRGTLTAVPRPMIDVVALQITLTTSAVHSRIRWFRLLEVVVFVMGRTLGNDPRAADPPNTRKRGGAGSTTLAARSARRSGRSEGGVQPRLVRGLDLLLVLLAGKAVVLHDERVQVTLE